MGKIQNDWLAISINNPQASVNQLLSEGINADNTQFQSKDYYKNTKLIQDKFTENGVFNDQAFNQFYAQAATSFNQFKATKNVDMLQYDPFDTKATARSLKKNSFLTVSESTPTDYIQVGTPELVEKSTYSIREQAKLNRYFDSDTGWSKNRYTDDFSLMGQGDNAPNAGGLVPWLSQIWDTKVLAKYDEDTEEKSPYTGDIIKHKKGEVKRDLWGNPYIEDKKGESKASDEIVNLWDTLSTTDNSDFNIFKTDMKHKSAWGTAARVALIAGATFIPYVGQAVLYAQLAQMTAKALPMLMGVFNTHFDWSDQLANSAKATSGGVSDYGQQGFFNWESMVNLTGDVAMQWGQQALMAANAKNIFLFAKGSGSANGAKALLSGAEKEAKAAFAAEKALAEANVAKGLMTAEDYTKVFGTAQMEWNQTFKGAQLLDKAQKKAWDTIAFAQKVGQKASLMGTLTQYNGQLYEQFREKGLDYNVASGVALGATLMMFGVDNYLGLGELFFDPIEGGLRQEARGILVNGARNWANIVRTDLGETTAEQATAAIAQGSLLQKFSLPGIVKTLRGLQDKTTPLWGKALGEGLEEVSEEIATDVTKQIYNWTTETFDIGPKLDPFKDAGARYLQSFIGGFLGGGMYGLKHSLTTKNNPTNKTEEDTQRDMVRMVANNQSDQLLSELDKMHKKGELGSTTDSNLYVENSEGGKTYLTVNEENKKSQNDFIYESLRNSITSMQSLLQEADVKDDAQLVTLQAIRNFKILGLEMKASNEQIANGFLEDYTSKASQLLNLQTTLQEASKTIDGNYYEDEEERKSHQATDEQVRALSQDQRDKRDQNLQRIVDQINDVKAEIKGYNDGQYSREYLAKLMFSLDPNLQSERAPLFFSAWLSTKYRGTRVEDLTDAELQNKQAEYALYREATFKDTLENSFADFNKNYESVKGYLENLSKMDMSIAPDFGDDLKKLLYDEDSVLNFKTDTWQGETEESESFKNREDAQWKAQREQAINQKNSEIVDQYLQDNEHHNLDPKFLLQAIPIVQGSNMTFNVNDLALGVLSGIQKNNPQLLHRLLEATGGNIDLVQDIVKSYINDKYLNDDSDASHKLNRRFKSLQPDPGVASVLLDEIPQIIDDYYRVSTINGATELDLFTPNGTSPNTYTYLSRDGIQALQADPTHEITFNDLNDAITTSFSEDEKGVQTLISILNILAQSRGANIAKMKQKDIRHTFKNMNWKIGKDLESTLNSYFEQGSNKYTNVLRIIKYANNLDLSLSRLSILRQQGLLPPEIRPLEDVLKEIHQLRTNAESGADFILTDEQVLKLNQGLQFLNILKQQIIAARGSGTRFTSIPLNESINQIQQVEGQTMEDRIVIDSNIADKILNEIGYLQEYIGVRNKKTGQYGIGSILAIQEANTAQKKQQFIRADKALTSTIYEIFQQGLGTQVNFFNVTLAGNTVNLLEGVTLLGGLKGDVSDNVLVNQLMDTFHDNIEKLVKQGFKYDEILEQVFEKFTKVKDTARQLSSNLDEHLNFSSLTAYDKVIMLSTMAAMRSSDFYAFLKRRIIAEANIAPLSIQEWTTRIGVAYTNNSEVFKAALNYISKGQDKLPILNGIFIAGGGGTGKTSVVAKNIANFVQGEIWLSAPRATQARTLLNSVGRGEVFVNDEAEDGINSLLEKMGLDAAAIRNAKAEYAKDDNKDPGGVTRQMVNGNIIINVDPSKFGVSKVNNAPQALFIDEATHLSNLEAQLISAWCDLNDTKLIMLGDPKQNGNTLPGTNISKETSLLIRTPTLNVSLRDNNVPHASNLTTFGNILTQLLEVDENSSNYDNAINSLRELTTDFSPVWSKDKGQLTGDLFTSTLLEEHVNLLSGEIGFVGDPNSATLQLLKSKGLNVTVLSETAIQGQEFDYLVADKEIDPNKVNTDNYLASLMQSYYTLISRGKRGSIIVSSTLENLIKAPTELANSSDMQPIAEYTDDFRREKLGIIDTILGSSNPHVTPENAGANSKGGLSGNQAGAPVSTATTQQTTQQQTTQQQTTAPQTTTQQTNPAPTNNVDPDANKVVEAADGQSLLPQVNTTEPQVDTNVTSNNDPNAATEQTQEESNKPEPEKKQKEQVDPNDKPIVNENEDLDEDEDEDNDEEEDSEPNEDIEEEEEDDDDSEMDSVEEIDSSPFNAAPDEQETLGDLTEEEAQDIFGTKGEALLEGEEDGIEEFIDTTPGNVGAYGELTLLGLNTDGYDWIVPNESDTHRDIELFVKDKNPGDRISDRGEQIDLQTRLLTLKQLMLRKAPWEEAKEFLATYMTKEEYNAFEYYAVARSVNDRDEAIRNIGMKGKENMLVTNPKTNQSYAMLIIGRTTINGKTYEITLGALSNPWADTNAQAVVFDRRINRLNHQIEKVKNDINSSADYRSELEGRRQKLLDDWKRRQAELPKYQQRAEALFHRASQNNNYAEEKLADVKFPGFSRLVKMGNIVRLSRLKAAKIRSIKDRLKALEENTSSAAVRMKVKLESELKKVEQEREHSFSSLNPYTIVSPMYIYTGRKQIMDKSIVGQRGVIFVTDDHTLRNYKEQLRDIYLQQKLDKQEAAAKGLSSEEAGLNPRVRAIVLNNLGVSIYDLIDSTIKDISKVIDGEGKTVEYFPFNAKHTGIRMYVNMWNYRANLTKFVNLATSHIQGNIYKLIQDNKANYEFLRNVDSKQESILKAIQDIYAKGDSDLINKLNKEIDAFNINLTEQGVPQFRLAEDVKNGNNFYIRSLEGSEGALQSMYGKYKYQPHGVYINMQEATKQLNLINSLFNDILDQVISCDLSPELPLTTKRGYSNSYRKHLRDVLKENGVLTAKSLVDKNGISLKEGSDVFTENVHISAKIAKNKSVFNSFIHIPFLISKIYQFSNFIPLVSESKRQMLLQNYTLEVKNKKESHKLDYSNIINQLIPEEGAIESDKSFSNLLSVMFHGTLEDVQRAAPRATDALFPKGFFVDPMASDNGDESSGTFKRVYDQHKVFFGVDVRLERPMMFVQFADEEQVPKLEAAPKPVEPKTNNQQENEKQKANNNVNENSKPKQETEEDVISEPNTKPKVAQEEQRTKLLPVINQKGTWTSPKYNVTEYTEPIPSGEVQKNDADYYNYVVQELPRMLLNPQNVPTLSALADLFYNPFTDTMQKSYLSRFGAAWLSDPNTSQNQLFRNLMVTISLSQADESSKIAKVRDIIEYVSTVVDPIAPSNTRALLEGLIELTSTINEQLRLELEQKIKNKNISGKDRFPILFFGHSTNISYSIDYLTQLILDQLPPINMENGGNVQQTISDDKITRTYSDKDNTYTIVYNYGYGNSYSDLGLLSINIISDYGLKFKVSHLGTISFTHGPAKSNVITQTTEEVKPVENTTEKMNEEPSEEVTPEVNTTEEQKTPEAVPKETPVATEEQVEEVQKDPLEIRKENIQKSVQAIQKFVNSLEGLGEYKFDAILLPRKKNRNTDTLFKSSDEAILNRFNDSVAQLMDALNNHSVNDTTREKLQVLIDEFPITKCN